MDEENTEYIKLPVTERCVHKSWKARVHGYTEAAKLFQQIDDEKSPEWNKFLGLVKKFVIDSNAVAQEKGLEAVLAFVENSAVAGKTVGDVMSGIVAKCIGAPKAKTKELAAQISLMYIEQEKQEFVIEELLKGTEHKNPKVVCGCINVITEAIREFGVKVVNVKPLVKKIPSLLEDRDKGVRDEGKAMVVEMHRWIGAGLTPQLSALKPVQMTELEAEFEKARGEKAVPTRYLRSQQARQAKEAAEVGDDQDRGAGNDEDEPDGQEIDPYELMEPVNILAKLPKDFYEKIEAKKWQDRKEAMEALETLLKNAPKLENGDYFELVKVLRKLISKDSNVMVVALATKNLGGLATGLKKRFSQYASGSIPVLLEKFREKKANVVTALREAIDAVYQSTTLEAIQEDVLSALDNKNPSVKAETAIFLARCFQRCTTLILTKKLLKVYTSALCKTLNESDPTVRDNSAEALGTALKVVGEKAITPFLENIDSLKLAKIKECSEKAELLVKQPTVKAAAVKSSAGAGDRPGSAAVKPSAGSTAPKAVKRPQSSKTQKPAAGAGQAASRKGTNASSNAGKAKSNPKVTNERELSDEEVQEKAEVVFSQEILNGLADSNWKTRLAVMEQFTQILGTLEPATISSQVLFKVLNKKPGVKDTNFQVAKLKLEAVKTIASTFPVTSVGVSCIVLDIVDKMNEPKTSAIAGECLTELADATKLELVSTEVLDYSINKQKSPKVQVEVFNWLSNALLEFGFQVNAKSLMENVKKGVCATNPVVRTAAISLLGTLYVFMGPQLHLFFENEKPALVQQINTECDRRAGEAPPAPVRGLRRSRSQDLLEDGGGDDGQDDCQPPTPCIQDIVPRTDITGFITDALVSEMQDKNWKVRSEAIQKLQNIINELRFISGSLGEVAPLLGARLVDSNSKIAQNAIALCESIATASGSSGCKQYVRHFFPGLLQCTGDSKAWIRTAAVNCINTYGELCGYNHFFDGEMIYDALKGGSPALRSEVWTWLSVKLPNMKVVPKDELLVCMPLLFANLEDRNADVRKNASEALVGFMYHLNYSPMMSACEKLKPASALQVRGLLDKARCQVPEKPAPASKAKNAGSTQALNTISGAQSKMKLAPGSSATITKSSSKLKSVSGKASSAASGGRKDEEVDVTPLLPTNNQKNQRVIDEQKLKTLKWNFTQPREEFVDLLRDQMTAAGINKAFIGNMFHADFKYHLKAIDQLNEDLGCNLQSLACNLDLILRWMTLRFFDTNPSVILKGLEYLQTAFNMLIDDDYVMLESEAAAFIPYLVLKVGDPKDAVRNSVRALFKQIVLMYPVSRMFTYIMDGLKSKNARQRSECLEQLGSLIETVGTTVCQPSATVALKEIAKHISDRDNSVRNGALNCIVAAYFLDGEKVLKTVGQISDKDMSLLEERIKRAAKNRPIASIKPIQPVQPQPASRPLSAVRPVPASPPHQREDPVDEEMEEPVIQASPTPRQPQPQGYEATDVNEHNSSGEFGGTGSIDGNAETDHNLSFRSHSQPVPGPYSLDPAFLASIEVPVVIQRPTFKEVDLSFLQEPVPQISRFSKLSSTSPLSKLSHPSTIEWQLQQMGSTNLETVLNAMSQIETVLLSEKRNNLLDHVDSFVTQLVNQLIFLNQCNHPDVVNCYRMNFSLLMKLYYYPELSCKVTEGVIKSVIDQLISLLTEKKLEMYDSTEMFVKVVNCLVFRILERSEHTGVVCALLKLLYDTVNNTAIPSLYQELIMKCTWRVVKFLPDWDEEELDYDRILPDIHTFLKDYPSHWWKKQPSDTPLRTVKTLLHTLVKLKGFDLMTNVKKVKGITPESEMSTYCNKLLRTLKVDNNATSEGQEKKENCKPRRMCKSFRDQLSDIFIKIGSKTETKEGLRLLYEFKQQHPDADIQPFLEKSTKFFQDYIQRGLQSIEMEQRHLTGQQNHTDNMSEKESLKMNSNKEVEELEEIDPDNPDLQQMHQFMKRLRVLQAKANLISNTESNNAVTTTTNPARPSTPPNEFDTLPSRKTVFESPTSVPSPDKNDVESIRQRLEKIKESSRLDTSS